VSPRGASAASKGADDERRGITGIIHVLRSGGRWIDAAPDFVRRANKGIWLRLFETLAPSSAPVLRLMIDSSGVKAHLT
jgi:hypothetical protein